MNKTDKTLRCSILFILFYFILWCYILFLRIEMETKTSFAELATNKLDGGKTAGRVHIIASQDPPLPQPGCCNRPSPAS